MKYTGFNKILKSDYLQEFLDNKDTRTYRDFLSDWMWILSYTKKQKWNVLLYTFVRLFYSTLTLASSYVTSKLINIIFEKDTSTLSLYIILTLLTSILSILLNAIRRRVSIKIELDLLGNIQSDLYSNILDLSYSELRKYKNGDLLNRFNKDMDTIIENAITWIPNIIINLYTFIITVILLLNMDPNMAIIALLSAPFVFFMSHYILTKQKMYRQQILQLDSDMMSFEAETFYNIDTIKSFGVSEVLEDRLTNLQDEYKINNLKYNSFQIKANIALSFINTAVSLGALGYCLYRLWNGDILYGDMTFFLTQRSSLSSLFESLISSVPSLLNASISAHRIREFLSLDKEIHNEKAYQSMKAHSCDGLSIEMKGLTFAYSDSTLNQEAVYENATFEVHPGEIVAVLAESGGGKTTLFRLLLGLLLPNKGQVVLKDSKGHKVNMNADLRKFISYVPQGNTMMMGSIRENMCMVKNDANDQEIIHALKTACAYEFVEEMGGIDAKLSERGKGISEGQAQRIAIARAILRDAPILFLDEATSALDEQTEKKVIDNILQNSSNKAIVLSTHRRSALNRCKRIYRILDKKIEVSSNI